MDPKARRRAHPPPAMDPKVRRAPLDMSKRVTPSSKGLLPRKESVASTPRSSHGLDISLPLERMLKSKIVSFRENLNMASPKNVFTTLRELLIGTMKDLQSKYHKSISGTGISKINCESSHQALVQYYKVLKYVGDLWAHKCSQTEISRFEKEVMDPESLSSQQLGERVLDKLSRMGSRTREMFDLMEKNSAKTSVSKAPSVSPVTPTSVLPETSVGNSNQKDHSNLPYVPPLLRPLRLQAVSNFKPVDGKRFSFHMVPVVVDQNSYSMHQTDQVDNDLKLDFVEAVMSMEPIPGDATVCDGNGNAEGKPSETATMLPHMLHLRQPLFQSPISSPMKVSGNGGGVDNKVKPSEATIPASPPSLPMLRLRAPALQSATPTPPPSPMVLRGLYMSMDQPFAYAMTIDDIDIGTINDICNDNDFRFKPSQDAVTSSSPSLPTSQLSTASKNAPSPPPPSSSVQQANKSTPPAAPLPPPPPPPQSRSAPAPAPPLPPPSKGSAPSAPPPPLLPQAGCGPPPPPPSGAMRALHAKKNSKLKRSSQMGNLYRLLKGKVEGSSLNGRASQQGKRQVGGGSGDGKGQGMADALAEITKRSAYFRQIEEDVEKYATSILELKSAIGSFRTKEMDELKKFHQHVEQQLEKLSDETQVLARFEDFPYKKLETLRMAVALYSKLDGIATTLRNWKVMSPIAQQLDKVECYFNKIKEEMDATDRNKDEESKRFQSHNIEFDFSVLIRIKESMVDLSSNCIEIALKESKESKETAGESSTPRSNGLSKMLWRAFQLAFRAYNFAGGQDDRADRLTSELAREIETFPQF